MSVIFVCVYDIYILFILDVSICFKHHLTSRNSKLMANSKFPTLSVDIKMTRIYPGQFYNLTQSFILPSSFFPTCSSFCLQFPCYTNWAKIKPGNVWQFDNKTTQTAFYTPCFKFPAHDEEPPAARHGVAPGHPGLLLCIRVAALPHRGGVHSPAGELNKYVLWKYLILLNSILYFEIADKFRQ